MDKLKLAHDYALVRLTCSNPKTLDEIIRLSWYYADAMQAEAEKRVNKERPEVLCEVDWSQAPEWAVAWTIDSGEILWWSHKPAPNNGYWFIDDSVIWKCADAPSFGLTGNHIVERPQ